MQLVSTPCSTGANASTFLVQPLFCGISMKQLSRLWCSHKSSRRRDAVDGTDMHTIGKAHDESRRTSGGPCCLLVLPRGRYDPCRKEALWLCLAVYEFGHDPRVMQSDEPRTVLFRLDPSRQLDLCFFFQPARRGSKAVWLPHRQRILHPKPSNLNPEP